MRQGGMFPKAFRAAPPACLRLVSRNPGDDLGSRVRARMCREIVLVAKAILKL